MQRIRGVVKDYSWGSPEAIPRLLHIPPTGHAVAEVWFGAHPAGPARMEADVSRTLTEVIAADPAGVLGSDVLTRFGPKLPYLLKLIAPRRPLSLQVHPTLEQAALGFAQEQSAGLAPAARSFTDANHKPEVVYALTTFEAMCGLRAPRRAYELLAGLGPGPPQDLAALVRGGTGGVRAALAHLLSAQSRPSAQQIDQLVDACADRLARGTSPSARADRAVLTLHEHHPGDPAVLAALLLNPVTLRPGEALFVAPGTVHAYLCGVGVEIQAASDNVLRGGLTSKRTDVPGMLRALQDVAAPPIRIAPETQHAHTRVFYAPVDDFELSITELPAHSGQATLIPGRGPRLLLILAAAVTLTAGTGGSIRLHPGEAVLVRSDEGALTVQGQPGAQVIQAGLP